MLTKRLSAAVSYLLAAVILVVLNPTSDAQDQKQDTISTAADGSEKVCAEIVDPQGARLEELEKTLSGAALVGRFTDSSKADGLPTPERYELAAVKHLGNNQWLFKARIRYGEHDVTVPLTLPILWAGDTPVITVDKAPVIGLGQFDARVMIFRDHYAGYWSGGDHGGHLFGKVVRERKAEAAAPEKVKPAANPKPAVSQ
ncbi:MAG: hypothetical protein RH917_04190 [Lacipirellulaceae bacterium]